MGLLVEIMVSVLLAVTIWYCVSLDKRLKRLKEDEESFRKLIGDLGVATSKAEAAVPGLRIAAAEAEQSLGERLKQAEVMLRALDGGFHNGEAVLMRIAQIVASNRAAEDAAEAEVIKFQVERARSAQASDRVEKLSDAARAARELATKARDRKLAEAA
jgi:Domain of unknown function (DUF6468)